MAARRSSAKTARSKKKTPAAGKDSGRRKKAKATSGTTRKTQKKSKKTAKRGKAKAGKTVKKKVTKKKSTTTKKKAPKNKGQNKSKKKTAKAGRTSAARKTRAKAGSDGKQSKKKAKASSQKTAAKPARKKKGTRGRGSKGADLDREAVDQFDAAGVIERLQLLTHVEADSNNEVSLLIERLDTIASEADLPAMFGTLTGDDPLGIQWSIFFIMERFDDYYLKALLEALPGLHERAPEWAQTAVIRILNTREDDDDDCTEAFETMAMSAPADQRDALIAVLQDLANDPSGDLLPQQRESIELTLRALGEEPPEPDPLQLAGAREG